MTKQTSIVPVILSDKPTHHPSTSPQKPKLACQLKVGATELRIYNGANQYILTTVLKELQHDAR